MDIISELDSIPRLEILYHIKKSPLKLCQISKKTGSTVQAIKRHLERLLNAKLIKKEINGEFSLTTIGHLALLQIDFFEFFSKNKEFFLNHRLDGIPECMIRRMGELNFEEYETNTMRGLQRSRDMIVNNQQWCHGMAATMPLEFFDTVIPNLKNNVHHKIIFGKNTIVPKGFSNYPSRKIEWLSAKNKKQVEEKFIENVPINVVVTESEALLAFFDKDVRFDSKTMFFGKDDSFRKWCSDLFDYFWDEVSSVAEFPIKEIGYERK